MSFNNNTICGAPEAPLHLRIKRRWSYNERRYSDSSYDLASRPAFDERSAAAAAGTAVDRPDLSTKSPSEGGVTDETVLQHTGLQQFVHV